MKRVRWVSVGIAIGVGGSSWARRKVTTTIDRYRPSGLAGDALERARDLPTRLGYALEDGRSAMREREAQLRSRRGP